MIVSEWLPALAWQTQSIDWTIDQLTDWSWWCISLAQMFLDVTYKPQNQIAHLKISSINTYESILLLMCFFGWPLLVQVRRQHFMLSFDKYIYFCCKWTSSSITVIFLHTKLSKRYYDRNLFVLLPWWLRIRIGPAQLIVNRLQLLHYVTLKTVRKF